MEKATDDAFLVVHGQRWYSNTKRTGRHRDRLADSKKTTVMNIFLNQTLYPPYCWFGFLSLHWRTIGRFICAYACACTCAWRRCFSLGGEKRILNLSCSISASLTDCRAEMDEFLFLLDAFSTTITCQHSRCFSWCVFRYFVIVPIWHSRCSRNWQCVLREIVSTLHRLVRSLGP